MIVAGAGMAGLVTASRLRQLGREVTVYEKGDRSGGSMLVSSGVIWRYRSLELFREQCPGGDERLQRLVVERFEDALEWLEVLAAEPVERETGNPLTAGRRYEPRTLTAVLTRAAGAVRLRTPAPPDADGLVLATGGFQGDQALVAEYIRPAAALPLRANAWSTGDGLRRGRAGGAGLSAGMDEFYGRNMPDAPFTDRDFISAAQLYARHVRVVNDHGEPFLSAPVSWSETDVVQATARQPGGAAWYLLDDGALEQRVRGRRVADIVAAAQALGGTVARADRLPFAAAAGTRVGVRVRAAITHTIGGLAVDARGRVLDGDGSPLDGLWAAGADAGGISAGGYASGLASALVLGLVAAEDAARA